MKIDDEPEKARHVSVRVNDEKGWIKHTFAYYPSALMDEEQPPLEKIEERMKQFVNSLIKEGLLT